jgi:hypothetical protein
MDEHEPTRQERRDERKQAEAKFRPDNRRSIRILAMLSVKPKPKRRRR